MDSLDIVLHSIKNNIQQVDSLSNNITNANTPGYLAQQVFSQFSGNEKPDLVEATSSLNSGGVKSTNRTLDVSILNEGFLLVDNMGEQLLTRNGRLHLNTMGQLIHASGAAVLGENGYISLPEGDISINEEGKIFVNDEYVDTLLTMVPANQLTISPMGKGLYLSKDGVSQIKGAIKQYSINGSSVSTSHDMIRLIEISRHTQSLQKAVLAIDQIANAGINELGKR